jgi:phage host-nuclease inhibitor protein Gam
MESIEKYITEEIEQSEALDPIFDLSEATNYMAKVDFVNRKIEEIEKVYKEYQEKIKKWRDEQINEFSGKKEFYEQRLIEYYAIEKNRNEKFKLKTPFGEVTQRETSKWIYDKDEGKIVRQLKTLGHEELVRVKEELDKNALKKKFKVSEGKVLDSETGELLEGVSVEKNVSYTVKVNAGLLEEDKK